MARHTESEFKLRAEGAIEVAAIDAALRELGTDCRRVDSQRHVDTYLDDDRGSLWQAGIGLRVRDGHQGQRLTCKLHAPAKSGLFVRTEIEADWSGPALPRTAAQLEEELCDTIQPFVLGRDLVPRQRLEVHRELRILTRHGHDLCELAIDAVEAKANGRSASFQEVELEVIDDLTGNEQLANALEQRLPLVFAERDKPSHAAALLGIEHGNGLVPDSPATDPVGRALQHRLGARLMAMRRAEIGVRREQDPKHVHRMRVAIRRMRSLVRAFRELWPDAIAAHLLGHLGETGRRLGAVRDLDVLLEQLPANVDALPPQLQATGHRTVLWVREQRDAARTQLHAWLRSRERLAASAELEQDLLAIEHDTKLASEPLLRAAPARLAKAVADLRTQISTIAPELPSGSAHRLRLTAKRVRYLAEECADLPGCRFGKSLRAVVRLQQTLGVVCDHQTAAERLLAWVHTAAAASPDGAWTAAALGGMATNHTNDGDAAREAAGKALARADKKRVWRRFAAGTD